MTLLVGVGLGVLGTVAWYERRTLQRHLTKKGIHNEPFTLSKYWEGWEAVPDSEIELAQKGLDSQGRKLLGVRLQGGEYYRKVRP
jgi:hypothetical protein